MVHWKSKSCPRCSGDVFIEMDIDMDRWYEQCLQCSHRRELKDLTEFGKQPASTEGTRVKG